MRKFILLITLLFCVTSSWAVDEMTVYELLDPASNSFAIRYDTATVQAGSEFYFNVIRPGSEASNEKVIDSATGKELPFELSTAAEAKKYKQADAEEPDTTKFIKIKLAHPVPSNGEYRLRILKTYRDPKSYFAEKDTIVFDRSLGIKRNIVIFPKGYELVSSSVPVIVSVETDSRIKVSMVNDREDELEVRIVGRKLKTGGKQ
jgi:hypothetical protein